MTEEEKKNLIIPIVRFILGFTIIAILEGIAYFIQGSPMLPFYGMVVLPVLIPLFLPPIITGIYFMFSSKMYWRLDIITLLISIICLVVFACFKFGNL